MISAFESLFAWAERIIKAKPLVATIGGGIAAYSIGFLLPLLLSLSFHLRMTDGWFSFVFVVVLALSSAFLVVFVHWTLARYCEHKLSQIFNFVGAMFLPALMFAVWIQMILFRGMD